MKANICTKGGKICVELTDIKNISRNSKVQIIEIIEMRGKKMQERYIIK